MIQSDSVGGMRDHLAWSGAGFKILVHEEDVAAATEILEPPGASDALDSIFPPEDPSHPPGRCFT